MEEIISKLLAVVDPIVMKESASVAERKCKKLLNEMIEVSKGAIDDFYDSYIPFCEVHPDYMEMHKGTNYNGMFMRTGDLENAFEVIPVHRVAKNKWNFGLRERSDGIRTMGWSGKGDPAEYVVTGAINLGYHGTSDIAVSTPPMDTLYLWWLQQNALK